MRNEGSCLEKEIIQGTVPGGRGQGRPKINWMDNIRIWTGRTHISSTTVYLRVGQLYIQLLF